MERSAILWPPLVRSDERTEDTAPLCLEHTLHVTSPRVQRHRVVLFSENGIMVEAFVRKAISSAEPSDRV